jgi:hypothetical protein
VGVDWIVIWLFDVLLIMCQSYGLFYCPRACELVDPGLPFCLVALLADIEM